MDKVISLTKDKVWEENINGKDFFVKRTKINEVENLKKAKNFLNSCNNKILIDNKEYQVLVPEIFLWDSKNECMYMRKCYGDNLEIMLQDKEKRKKGILFLHSILKYILNNGFYWKDFAPRNILIGKNSISLVDFERGLDFEKNDLKQYFRENVYEEYVAFLLPEERPISPSRVFDISNEKNYYIDYADIKSTRVKAIAKRLKLDKIKLEDYVNIVQMIIKAEEPKKCEENIIFPIVELEEIASTYGFEAYINEILKRNNIYLVEERDV